MGFDALLTTSRDYDNPILLSAALPIFLPSIGIRKISHKGATHVFHISMRPKNHVGKNQ